MTLPLVGILDACHAPSVSFVRSLARASVPFSLFAHGRLAAARWSRDARDVKPAPPVEEVDELVDWLCIRLQDGSFDVVAPTSDHVAFCVAEARERLGVESPAHPTGEAVRDCLFKDRFASRLATMALPTPPGATPASRADARVAAEGRGYPLLVKPRSHVAVGQTGGTVVADERELEEAFVPSALRPGRDVALEAGHVLAVMDAGAYFVPFATSFSFPQPAIVLQDGDDVVVARRAETFADLVARDEP